MGIVSDLRILYRMTVAPVHGGSHGERLEAFYRGQSEAYDDFRRRLLHGREELMQALDLPDGGCLLDLGGGTGQNVEFLGSRRERMQRIEIVDLCPSLLDVANQRIQRHGWTNVRTVAADATTYRPDVPMDAVTFSYSLTMIPDWFRAIDNALAVLKPGGVIGVVDFFVSRKWPAAGQQRHSLLRRWFWRSWFAWDNVFLSPDHLPYLQQRFETLQLQENAGRVPYLPGLKAPYYIFIGRKRSEPEASATNRSA